ncbi:MAG: ThiF family adenylyltransferase [Candidatus Helarchaeota archaeon]
MKWQEIVKVFEDYFEQNKEMSEEIRTHIRDRCLGILSEAELERVRMTPIAVLGVGGIGMPLLEMLVRTGAEELTIVDSDIIDPTNMNRVPWAFPWTYGQQKIEVAELFCRMINPNVRIRKFRTINSQNVEEVLRGVKVAALTLDGLYSSLVAAKYCREHKIPMVEGWALAGILNARIFHPNGPSYEQVYNLKISKPYDALTPEEIAELETEFLVALSRLTRKTTTHYTSEGLRLMMDGAPRRSLASCVWIISAVLASELIFKLILNRPLPQKNAPDLLLYDYLTYKPLLPKPQKQALQDKLRAILQEEKTLEETIHAIIKLIK